MSDEILPHTGRATSAFRALDEDIDLARRRVWHRIQGGIELERRRQRRRARWIAGGIAAAAAAAAVLVPVAMNLSGRPGNPAPQRHEVSVESVAQMLGMRPAAAGQAVDADQFLTAFVTEASTGAQ